VYLPLSRTCLTFSAPPLHDLVFLRLLRQEFGGLQRLDDKGLRWVWAVGDFLARMIPMVFFSNASSSFGWDSAVGAAKVMKPVRKPQTILFLGGAVELDREDARMQASQLAEQRFLRVSS